MRAGMVVALPLLCPQLSSMLGTGCLGSSEPGIALPRHKPLFCSEVAFLTTKI